MALECDPRFDVPLYTISEAASHIGMSDEIEFPQAMLAGNPLRFGPAAVGQRDPTICILQQAVALTAAQLARQPLR